MDTLLGAMKEGAEGLLEALADGVAPVGVGVARVRVEAERRARAKRGVGYIFGVGGLEVLVEGGKGSGVGSWWEFVGSIWGLLFCAGWFVDYVGRDDCALVLLGRKRELGVTDWSQLFTISGFKEC